MSDYLINKDNINTYLYELAKQTKKMYKPPEKIELILVGGASILINYDFRGMTNDIDALMSARSLIKDAAVIVGEKYGLPKDWINSDMMNTDSYSRKLYEHSTYYKTFCNCIEVRTVSSEYLVAMKLCSGRSYKRDLSDIAGIIQEHRDAGTPLSLEKIQDAYCELYGSWDDLSTDTRYFIENRIFGDENPLHYDIVTKEEDDIKEALQKFEEDYPDALNKDNIDYVIRNIMNDNTETENESQCRIIEEPVIPASIIQHRQNK